MSTEIIAQIDFASCFCRLQVEIVWQRCHFRLKCPAMCCSQTAESSRVGLEAGLLAGRAGAKRAKLCALPEIITQLGFLWGLQQTLPTHTHSHPHPSHTHSDTLAFNLYYLCSLLSGICFALSPPFAAAHFVYLSGGRLY